MRAGVQWPVLGVVVVGAEVVDLLAVLQVFDVLLSVGIVSSAGKLFDSPKTTSPS